MQQSGRWKGAGRLGLLPVLALLVSCHGPALSPEQMVSRDMDAMRKIIPEVVRDAGRAQQILHKVDELQLEIVDFDAQLLTLGRELRRLNADPDATSAQFSALFSRFDAQRLQSRRRLMDTHFGLLALTSAQEWSQLAPHERDALVVIVKLQGDR